MALPSRPELEAKRRITSRDSSPRLLRDCRGKFTSPLESAANWRLLLIVIREYSNGETEQDGVCASEADQ